MKQRLEQFLAAENLTQAQFADRISVARAGISHIMAGRNNPGYEFILNTMNAFPLLNIEWLLCGKGKMYKNEGTQDSASPAAAQMSPAQDHPAVATPSDNAGTSRTKAGISRIVVFFEDGTFKEFC